MSAYTDYCEYIQNLSHSREHPERKKHRLPLEYYTASDCEYFFTINAKNTEPPFVDTNLASAIIDALLCRKKHHGWTLYVYCLMPDHLHFVVRLPEQPVRYFDGGARGIVPETVLDQIGSFKRYTTTQLWWVQGGKGQLWQKSSYDTVIRYERTVEHACNYVLDNPVRKGIVDRWEDYPFSGIVDPW